jgi:alkylation response protein AidB-like acyl-CoA dehydrogenase
MTQAQDAITGGQFLTTAVNANDVFTREELTDEQRLFGQTAAEFMTKEVLPVVERLYKHDWELTRQLLRKASDLDLLRLEIPPEYGGLGLDLISASYVGEQIAVNPSFGGSLGAHTSIGTLPLVHFGTDEQKARYLPRLASGELIGAYCLTEPQSGSDALAARTSATLTPDGRHYLLNGQKMWITNGGFADLFTIFAKVDGQFTGFLVERGMGVVSGRDETKLGLDGSSTTALMLDNVKVPVENVLGQIGQGHKVAFNVLNFGRVKLGARNMSGVKLALAHASKYAKERRQFGKAIAEFGLIKQKLAGMAIRAFIGDAMSYRALGDVDRAIEATGSRSDGQKVMKTIEGFAVECSINKVWTSEALAWAVDEGLQVFGGNGYSREFPLERMYRDARITRIYEGTNEINRMLVPGRLLKQSPSLFTVENARKALKDGTASAQAGPLAAERDFVARAKRVAVGLLGHATATYGDGFKDAQEVQAQIADIVIEAYAIDSGIARAEKMAARADGRAALAADAVRVYASDAADKIAGASRQVVAALVAAGVDAGVGSSVLSLVRQDPVDTISARRRIADAVTQAGKSPF